MVESETAARILVIEDDIAIRSALEVSLRNEGYEVRAEADGMRIKQIAYEFLPDLAILDVRLPVAPDGYTIGRYLRAASDAPLMFLTSADGVKARLAGFAAGADDYLLKPFSMAELLARLRALLRRSGRVAPGTLRVADLVIHDSERVVDRGDARVELTRTEHGLLSALARRPNHVFSKVQLLSQVWGFDAYDVNLVEVHVAHLRQKLEAFGPRIIHTVRGVGYVLRS